MKLYIILLISIFIGCTDTFGQLSIHSIDFQAPIGGTLGHNNPINLGLTLNMPNKDKKLEVNVLGFGDNGMRYSTGLGSYNTKSYFDSVSNTFTTSERPKYNLKIGDSVLGQFQSTSRDALGLRIGLRTDYNWGNIPFYSSLSVGLIGARASYNRSEFYEKYDTSITNFGEFETSFPFTNFSSEESFSFIPQLNAQLGVILSLNERIKIIPKLSVNLTYGEYLSYDLAGATSSYRDVDFSMVASFQLSYLLRKKD